MLVAQSCLILWDPMDYSPPGSSVHGILQVRILEWEAILKLKLQYFGHLMWTDDSLEKILVLGKIEGRRRGHRRTRCLDGITDAMDMNLGKLQEMVRVREAWHAAVCGVTESQTWLGDWTAIIAIPFSRGFSQLRDQTQVSCLQADSLLSEAAGKPEIPL